MVADGWCYRWLHFAALHDYALEDLMERLKKYERETLISFNVAERKARVYTHDKRIIRRLDQMAADYPDTYKLIADEGDYKEYELPKKYVSFSKPRKLSPEQIQEKRKLIEKIRKS